MSVPRLAEAVARTVVRDLGTLADEVEAYSDDEALWTVAPGTKNSGGVLANHLTGNLLHYVGAQLGDTGYVRDRRGEFGARDLPRDQLLARIERTRAVVDEVLGSLTEADLEAPFPDPPSRMAGIRTGDFLLHLVSHLGYHLGQVNYHRRILEAGEGE